MLAAAEMSLLVFNRPYMVDAIVACGILQRRVFFRKKG